MMTQGKLRVLLVPDSLYWITGTMAAEIVEYSPWIDGQVVSAVVLDHLFSSNFKAIHDRFDLVHFLCQYRSRDWLPRLQDNLPVVTSLYHIADWDADKHNMAGDAVMTIAQEWVDSLANRGQDLSKVLIHSTGVDTEFFLPPTPEERESVRSRIGVPTNNIAIGFFAKKSSNNGDDRKGTGVFIEAIKQLASQVNKISVVIVGPGWQDFVEELRAKGVHCIWLKFLKTRQEVAATYRALDFYWVTSRIEGGPVPLLESMSTEVCCITTPVGLVPEIGCNGKNLVIVPIGDVGGFITETKKLIADPSQRMSIAKEGRKTVVLQKDVRLTTKDIGQLYDRAFDHYAARKRIERSTLPQCRQLAGNRNESLPDLQCKTPLILPSKAACLEKSFWGTGLCAQGQKVDGLNWILSGLLHDPFCATAWKLGLLCLLPPKLTSLIVKAKG